MTPEIIRRGDAGWGAGKMKAAELLPLVIDWLAERYADSLIVPEFSIGTWGAALLDVAAITESEIIGVEIKGAGDSPARLPLQASLYSKAATRMFFLACPELEARCFKHLPSAWGRLRVRDGKIEPILTDHQRWVIENICTYAIGRDPEPAEWLCTAPLQLLQCLWRDELDAIASRLGLTVGRLDVESLRRELAERVALRELRPLVCELLRERRWTGARGSKHVIWARDRLAA